MDLLKKILQGVLGVAFWGYIFAVFFIEGTYIPFVSNENASSATTTTRPPMHTSSPRPAEAQRPPAPKVVPEIYAMELFQEFKSDQAAANRKYAGRTIIVSGLHFRVTEDPFSAGFGASSYVYIEEQTGWMESETVVKCGVSEAVAQSIAAVENPHMIKLKGQVQSFYANNQVELNDCALVSLN